MFSLKIYYFAVCVIRLCDLNKIQAFREYQGRGGAIEKLGQKGSTVDSKGVGKPFTFSSDEARIAARQNKLRNYVAAALPGARVFMDWAGDQGSNPITRTVLRAAPILGGG